MTQDAKPNQNKWDLIIGVFLILLGSYRLYNFYANGAEYSTLRIALTYAIVGFGCYNIYKYIKAGQA